MNEADKPDTTTSESSPEPDAVRMAHRHGRAHPRRPRTHREASASQPLAKLLLELTESSGMSQ